MRKSKKERQQLLTSTINENPFITDEDLAEKFQVSVQTIRLDRLELSIPELRERIKTVAEKRFDDEVRSLPLEEVIGEIIHIELDQNAISIFDVKKEHVFKRNNIARGHHVFAQANSLAVAVINDELALTAKANIQFNRLVKLNERVIAKAKVTKIDRGLGRTSVEVTSFVNNELVFTGEFEMYRSKNRWRMRKMKLAIDAMGGDNAPKEIVLGALKAVQAFSDIHITLVGDENKIKETLTNHDRISVIHTTEVILGTDEPVKAVRRKKNASMVLAAQQVADGVADACISAGNTGALVAAGLFVVGRINGIHRPALAPTLPTIGGEGFLLLDVGANADAKPEHLLQYGLMGSIYSEKVRGISRPRVGLLNIGTEEKKGNELTKQAFELLKNAEINFVGNVEARDLLDGVADVVVTDGFTGNMVLKTIEGTALSMFKMLKTALMSSFTSKLAAAVLKPNLKTLKNTMDYSEYGGAALFGLNAPVIKAHGSSNGQAIFSAIRQTREMVSNDVVGLIKMSTEEENKEKVER